MYRILLPVDTNHDRAEKQGSFVASLPIDPDDIEVVLAHALSEDVSRNRDETGVLALEALFDLQSLEDRGGRTRNRNTVPSEPTRPSVDRISSVRLVAELLDDAGYELTIRELDKPVDEGIVDLAESIEADLIVMGGRKRSPAGKVVFGSTTHAVMTGTEIPLTVTGGG